MKLSVVICTHNPRPDYLRRVLEALKSQTLPLDQWELLLMDNVCQDPLANNWNLSWHPNARHIREEKIGKANAVLTAIAAAKGGLFLTVDDDNVLQADFLERALGISNEFPFLGAWGGHIEGEFEEKVPQWIEPYLHAMAIRAVERDSWSNYYADNRSMPFGAGLCVRKSVADAYAKAIALRPESKRLGRTGSSLISGEDIDLALTAYDIGLGTGMFRRLQITHLIPKTRMTVDYVCRLLEGIEHSNHLLKYFRDPNYKPPQVSRLKKWLRTVQIGRLPEPVKSFARAEGRGLARAIAEISAKTP